MDIFTKISGLQHISEDIFKLLGQNCLMNCRSTNSSWKNILDQSIFWLNKMKLDGWKALAKHLVDRQLAKIFANNLLDLNQPQWIASMQELENDHQPKEFVLILIKIYNNRKRLLPLRLVKYLMQANKYPDLVESILQSENPSSKEMFFIFKGGVNFLFENATSIDLAAFYGLTGVVETLSKKYDDPMVEDKQGRYAIHLAALNGHLNIVKHLMGFTDTPMAPDDKGWTPIHYAAINGNLDTIKFLVDLTNTPNAPNEIGFTPIEIAKKVGNLKIQKFLENYCK